MNEALYHAVESDDPEGLLRLLTQGANVNEIYTDLTKISTKSILHISCEKGRIECVRILLESGTNVSSRDTWGQTPLMYCMMTQYPEIASLILSHVPEVVDCGDKYGKSALHIAVEAGSLECVRVLLRYAAAVNILTDFGITPLMTACSYKTTEDDVSVIVEIVRTLLEEGAMHDLKCYRNKRTPLQMAVISKNVKAVELLLAAGADPSTTDTAGRTPLTNVMWEHGRSLRDVDEIDPDVMAIIVMLIQAGTDLNLSKYEQSNALYVATAVRSTFLVKYLLYNGADQNGEFYCGKTPLVLAAQLKDVDTTKVLLDWHSDLHRKGRVFRRELNYYSYEDAFCLALVGGAFEIAWLLFEAGYNISNVDYLTDRSIEPPLKLKEDPTMLELFRLQASNTDTLLKLSVTKIRQCIQRDISNNAELLPLPKLLVQAVQLNGRLL